METLDKQSRIPVYFQLMNIIIEQIENGTLKENDKLPAERELCEKYKISRTTVRQAIQELEKEGYINIQHGKGTFVSPKRYQQELLKFYSFTEEMIKLGKVPSTKVVAFEIINCDEKIARKVGKAVGGKLYKLTRLRYADKEPMMLVTSYIPYDRFPELDKNNFNEYSLYETFVKKYDVEFTRAKESLQAIAAGKSDADLLQCKVGSPSMLIERITYEKNQVIEYARGVARGDRFKYDITLER